MEHNFFESLKLVLKHEGGFVDHPKDPGGATNKGITHKTYSEFLGRPLEDVNELKSIPDEHVDLIYKQNYWDKIKGDDLPAGLDFSVFDWAVNSGPSRASKYLQKIVEAKQDGAIGPKTLELVNKKETKDLINKLSEERADYYKSLSTYDTFGRGWLRRNEETLESSLKMLGEENV
jgi:lysozyme family protein